MMAVGCVLATCPSSGSYRSCRLRGAQPPSLYLPRAFMYSSKFWLSVSFQVAQKASTILALSGSPDGRSRDRRGDLWVFLPLQCPRPLCTPQQLPPSYLEPKQAESQGFEWQTHPPRVPLSQEAVALGKGDGRVGRGGLKRGSNPLGDWLRPLG